MIRNNGGAGTIQPSNTEGGERTMTQTYRFIKVTEEERAKKLNHIDLNRDYGEFEAVYVEPESRLIYGLWRPSFRAVLDCAGKGYDIDTDGVYWAIMEYWTYIKSESREKELIANPDAKVSDFLRLELSTWEIYLPEQFKRMKQGRKQ